MLEVVLDACGLFLDAAEDADCGSGEGFGCTSNIKTYATPRNNSSGPYQIISTLVSDELACHSKRLLERCQGAFHRLCAEQLRWRYGEITNS